MNPSVAGAAGSELVPRLTNGSVCGDERRNDVTGAERACHRYLGVYRRRGSSHHGEAVAAAAAIEVEARTETLTQPLHFVEGVLPDLEQRCLVGGQARKGIAGAGSGADAGIRGGVRRRNRGDPTQERRDDGKRDPRGSRLHIHNLPVLIRSGTGTVTLCGGEARARPVPPMHARTGGGGNWLNPHSKVAPRIDQHSSRAP